MKMQEWDLEAAVRSYGGTELGKEKEYWFFLTEKKVNAELFYQNQNTEISAPLYKSWSKSSGRE